LLNTSTNKVDAHMYLWGACHYGFYSTLFHIIPSEKQSAYVKILKDLQDMVLWEDKQSQGETLEYSVFTTGHSLGGCLASTFYARLLKFPEELTHIHDHLHFEGGYVFGAPRIGSFDFMRQVFSELRNPPKRHMNLWRVANALDFASSIPLGEDNREAAFIISNGSSNDFRDYSHIGSYILLLHYGKTFVETQPKQIHSLQGIKEWYIETFHLVPILAIIFDFLTSVSQMFEIIDVMNIVSAAMPFVGDHSPFRYYISLSQRTQKDFLESTLENHIDEPPVVEDEGL